MATYNQIYETWLDETLRKQIAISVMKAATDVLNEDPATPNHAERKAWAQASLKDPLQAALDMSSGVVMNATIQAGDPTDADVQFVVNGLIDAYAV